MAGNPSDAFQLGQDVTSVAQPGGVDAQVPVGTLVGVKRSNGTVTVGRVEAPLALTPAGHVHVTLGEDRTCKDVPPAQLFILPLGPPGSAPAPAPGFTATIVPSAPAPNPPAPQVPAPASGGHALALGQDVTAVAQLGVDPAQLPIGTLVGVKRTNGSVTVGRVTAPAPDTPPGQVHVTLNEDGAWKDVTPDMLYTIPPPPPGPPAVDGKVVEGVPPAPQQLIHHVPPAGAVPRSGPPAENAKKDVSTGCFNCLPGRKKNS